MHKPAVTPLLLAAALVALPSAVGSQRLPVATLQATAGIEPPPGELADDASCFEGAGGELVLRASRRCSGARLQAQLREALGLPAEPGARPAEAINAPRRDLQRAPPASTAAGAAGASAATDTAGRASPEQGPSRRLPPTAPTAQAAPAPRLPSPSASLPTASRPAQTAPTPTYRVPAVPAIAVPSLAPAGPMRSPNARVQTAPPTAVGQVGSVRAGASPQGGPPVAPAPAVTDPARTARHGGEHPLNRLQQLRSIESGWRSSTVGRTP